MADKKRIAEALMRRQQRDANGRPLEPDYSFALPPEDLDPNAPVWQEAEPSFLDSLVDRFELNRKQMSDADNITASALQSAGVDTPILKQRRTEQTKKYNQLRPWYQADNPLQGLAEFGAATAGTLTGSVADPINFAGGASKKAIDTFANNAGISGIADALLQLTDTDKTAYNPASEKYNPRTGGFDAQTDEQGNPIEAWTAPEFDPMRTAVSAATGGTLSTTLAGQLPQLPRDLFDTVAEPAKKAAAGARKPLNTGTFENDSKAAGPAYEGMSVDQYNALSPEQQQAALPGAGIDLGQQIVDEFDNLGGFDPLNIKAVGIDKDATATAPQLSLFDEGALPNQTAPAMDAPTKTRRARGKRQVGKTIWPNPSNYGDPTGFDKSTIYHNPDYKTMQAIVKEAPYGELRFLHDKTTGDIHVWPAAHGFHNDAARAMGIVDLDRKGQLFHGYLNKGDISEVTKDFARRGEGDPKGIDDFINGSLFNDAERGLRLGGVDGVPHRPGDVNPDAPGNRLAQALLDQQMHNSPQVREEYPGVFSYRPLKEGETPDPRNVLTDPGLDINSLTKGMAGYTQATPGRFWPDRDFVKTKDALERGDISLDTYMGKGLPEMTPEERANYVPPDKRPATKEEMVDEWSNITGGTDLYDMNIDQHGLRNLSDVRDYAKDLFMDGDVTSYPIRAKERARNERVKDRVMARIKETIRKYEPNADEKQFSRQMTAMRTEELAAILDEAAPDLKLPPADWMKKRMAEVDAMDGVNPSEVMPVVFDENGNIRVYKEVGNDPWTGKPRKIWGMAKPVDIDKIMPTILKYNDELMDQVRKKRDEDWYNSLTPEQKKGEEYRKAFEAATRPKPTKKATRAPGEKADGGFDRLLKKRYQYSDSKGGDSRITVDDLDNIDNMDMSVHNDGEPVYKDLTEPRNVKAARAKMSKGTSRYDDPSMYGDPTGYPYTNIIHNPTIKQFMDVAKKSPYGEVRYLVDGNGDTHIWPAAHAYHDDVAQFMGFPGADDMIHGIMNKNGIKKVMEGYDPDNIQQLVFADQRQPRGPDQFKAGADHDTTYDIDTYMMDHGINNPVWSFEQARFDNQLPYRRAGDGINAAAKAIDPDLMNSAAAKATATAAPEPPKEANPYADWYDGFQREEMRRQRPRKKGEPIWTEKLGYTERQSKVGNDPLVEADLGDGFDAAASFDGNLKDWSKTPVKEIHDIQRKTLLDPKRPIPTEADAPRAMNMRDAKKTLTPEQADKVLNERRSVLGQRNEEKIVKATTLGTSISKSVAEHAKMSPAERALNLKAAEEVLSKAMGNKNGQVTRLFTKNAKLMKAEKGYEGGWISEPAKLPNKQGIETTGMALAPSSETRGFKTCPNSASCRDACLGFKAGQYYQGGVDGGPQTASRKRTQALLDHPDAYGVQMYEEIAAARRTAIKNGNILGVRLNVLSDVDPKVYKSLIEAFPDVWFYDYTKMNYRPIAPNHHVTYSSTGVSNKDVTNLNQNWSRMRAKLEAGDNVAMAFTDKKFIPKWVLDEETNKLYPTIDGVGTDFRPGDLMQTDGKTGAIVALKNMEQSTHKGVEHMETAGFLVPYDAKYKRNVSKTGKSGKYIRDERGEMIPTNEIAVIPKQVSRKTEREKARVQITVGGKDKSDYGGQSTGYTPDQSQAPAAGMKTGKFENDARAGNFVGKNTYKKPDKTAGSSGRRTLDANKMAAVNVANIRHKFGVGIDPAKVGKRTPAEMLPGIQDQNIPKRPFGYDYKEATLRAQGMKDGDKLTHTMRGTPIEAKHVIGRQTMGGDDVPLPDGALQDIAKYLLEDSPTRKKILGNTPGKIEYYDPPEGNLSKMGTAKGTFVRQDYPNVGLKAGDSAVSDILINDLFPADSKNQTLAHELGHGIHYEVANGKVDKFAKGKTMKGEIDKQSTPFRELPTSVKKELREVYHDAHTVSKEQFYHEPSGPRGNISPETQEYSSSATNEELMAEFFVVLRADPNYAKTIAPKAYQWLAEQIDAHPELRKTVQLNSVGGGLAGLLAMKMMEEQEGQQ